MPDQAGVCAVSDNSVLLCLQVVVVVMVVVVDVVEAVTREVVAMEVAGVSAGLPGDWLTCCCCAH
jgi:hypothetical protein